MIHGIDPDLVTIDGLEAWARGMDPEWEVGEAGASMHCPVAEFLQSLTEEAVVISVGGSFASIEEHHLELGADIESVVTGIDDLHDANAGVNAGTLVSVIESVKESR